MVFAGVPPRIKPYCACWRHHAVLLSVTQDPALPRWGLFICAALSSGRRFISEGSSVAKGRKTFREHSLRLCCSRNVFEMAVPKCQTLNYLLESKSKLRTFWTKHFKHSFEHSASARLTSRTARAAARSRSCARRLGPFRNAKRYLAAEQSRHRGSKDRQSILKTGRDFERGARAEDNHRSPARLPWTAVQKWT